MPLRRNTSRTWWAPAIMLGVLAVVGCEPEATGGDAAAETSEHGHHHDHDHDHGGRPDSLHEAVDHLAAIEQAIADAMASGDADAAHEPLHEVGTLLKSIPDIAAETDLPKEQWEAVKAAADRLMDAYGEIDHAFHTKDGDKQAAFEKVAGELTAALEEIRSRLPETGEDPSAHEHEHEHGDHDHEEGDHDHDEHDHADETTGANS